MLLKASYFSTIGIADSSPLSWGVHLQPAIQKGRSLNINWPYAGAGHNVRAWAELLVAEKAVSAAPFTPHFASEVLRCGNRLELLWRETLRYHKNRAYEYELIQARKAVEWFLVNVFEYLTERPYDGAGELLLEASPGTHNETSWNVWRQNCGITPRPCSR